MLNSDKQEDDLFFDSADCFSLEESIVTKGGSKFDNSVFEIWLNEPQSVKKRRESFLCDMGLAELACKSDEIIELERITECSGAISNSSALCTYREEESLVCCDREMNSEANSIIDDEEQEDQLDPNLDTENQNYESVPSKSECSHIAAEEYKSFNERKLKMKSWWKFFLRKVMQSNPEITKTNRMKVKQNKKRCMEFTGVYMGQELKAHNGFIWTMKFSPDGQYLATGGEDGVVRIWHVTSVDATHKLFLGDSDSNLNEGKSSSSRKKISHVSVTIPEKVFQIEEPPVHEFYGHASDVLDLAWSNSNCLLSSSKDKTVRLWQVGSQRCLHVFHHTNYVTCIHFNPLDENYFISGSIDGKVRIWGVSEKRVVDWVDARDVTSCICYQPDGKGFVVGSITGTCRFYKASGNDLQLEAEIHVQGRKRSLQSGITGIQFSSDRPQRLLISSEDSKLYIFDGFDIIHKFKGLPKSGSQMSASFASTGRHIISVSEDSHVYVWDYDGMCTPTSKHVKSVRSCEHFFYEGVSVAVPWSGMRTELRGLHNRSIWCRMRIEDGVSRRRDSERFSLGNCLFMDGPCRGSSATWPEEKLPHWDAAISEDQNNQQQHYQDLEQHLADSNDSFAISDAWGLVIVTAGFDGIIRTFHNYGLPVQCRSSSI